MRNSPRFAAMLFVFALGFGFIQGFDCGPQAFAQNYKHILVLHSYNKGLEWTDQENDGISSILDERWLDVKVHTEYMDTKWISDPEYYDKFLSLLEQKYASIAFNAIICSDDDAFNFVLKNHGGLFEGVPVVFCGVNYFKDSELRASRELVTGVVEAFDIPDTLRTALRLQPKTSEVVIINDRTTTGLANRKILDEVIPEFSSNVRFRFLEDLNMDELLQKVGSLPSGVIILLLTFNRDHSGRVFDYNQSIYLISKAAKVPIYGVWGFYLGKGIVGGMLTSGWDQGVVAARMALCILDGEPVGRIPVVRESPNRFMFDYLQLKRFGIALSALPEDSVIINRPASFYQLHQRLVWIGGGGVVCLITIILLLLSHIRVRRRVETALMKSEERFRALYESNPCMYFTVDEEGLVRSVNPFGAEQLGYMVDELLGKPVSTLLPADDQQMVQQKLAACLDNPDKVIHCEVRMVHKSGYPLWVREAARAVRSGEDNHFVILIVSEDITESKHSEEERMRLATAIEQAAEAIFITDTNWIIRYVNPAFEHMSGYGKHEIIGRHARILKSEKHDAAFYRNIRETLSRGEVWSGRLLNTRKDGTAYEAEVTASPVRDSSGTIINYVSIRRDITHEVRLEKELRQAQKMEAIGTLAGGIAHDFNNILSAIIGYTEMARRNMPDGSRASDSLNQVLNAASRATDLVQQILTFSRCTEQVRRPVSMGSIVKEALKFLRPSLPTTIEIRQAISVPLERTLVLADPTEIHQVLMNLCTNAAHAMRPTGGVLSVEVSETVVDDFFVPRHPDLRVGTYVCLTVSDTGHGIDPEVMERIFDPYFTTKGVGEGTGLGLSVVQGIVKSYGGVVTAYSKPGRRTTFRVYLPKLEGKVPTKAESVETLPTGTESILFVDDEETLADLGKEMLEALGYQVVAKTSSVEALETFRSDPHAFDLIITDMTMPGLTGRDLGEEVMAIRSDMPIILCTGFSELIDENLAREAGIRAFIMKPYVIGNLAQIIRKALGDA